MILNKLNKNITYPAVTNYWTPLYKIDDDKPTTKEEEINMTWSHKQPPTPTLNKWKRRIARQQEWKSKKEEERIIINLGATSHFVTEEMSLPRTGPSDITVYLPNNSTRTATGTTQLPFKKLSTEARKATILPDLTKSFISVNKMAESRYTTIFLPGDKGVTFHKEGTLTITTSEPPVLQGCQRKGETLWTVSVPPTMRKKREEVSNVYNLSSMVQTITYHHASAGYPIEDTWIKGINAGNYTSWPGLTAAAVRKYFSESEKTQKGHMKRQ